MPNYPSIGLFVVFFFFYALFSGVYEPIIKVKY